jgi:hypothetical protein
MDDAEEAQWSSKDCSPEQDPWDAEYRIGATGYRTNSADFPRFEAALFTLSAGQQCRHPSTP